MIESHTMPAQSPETLKCSRAARKPMFAIFPERIRDYIGVQPILFRQREETQPDTVMTLYSKNIQAIRLIEVWRLYCSLRHLWSFGDTGSRCGSRRQKGRDEFTSRSRRKINDLRRFEIDLSKPGPHVPIKPPGNS